MRVLAAIVVPPHLSVSGAARAGEKLSAALAEHCQMFVAHMGDKSTYDDSLPFVRVPVRTGVPFPLSWQRIPNKYRTLFYGSDIAAHIRSHDYDLVHLHNPMPALEMARIARACRSRGIPYVVSTHGFNEIANGERIYGFNAAGALIWRRAVLRPVRDVVANASAVFALSPADVPLIRDFGYEGAEVPIVSNGVELPAHRMPEAEQEAIWRRFDIPARDDRAVTCFFLANHTPNKGLPVLLEAFAALKRPYTLILGGERRAEIPYEEFEARCGPGQRIIRTGRLTDDEVTAMFLRTDLFVFPTLADTFPLVVLEAMVHGVPVVASDVGGIPYQLSDGAGVIVKPGDPSRLAAAIDSLADDPNRRMSIATAGLERVRRRFTWGAAGAEALSAYRRVLMRSVARQHARSAMSGQRITAEKSTRPRAIP